MPARKYVAPELIAECKVLYEETLTPTDEIGARMGLSRSAFYLRVKEWKWQRRRYSSNLLEGDDQSGVLVPDLPSQNETTGIATAADAEGSALELRAALFVSACRAVQRNMDIIARVQATLWPAHPAQSERTVRIIATLNKSLLEVAATTKPDQGPSSNEADDDTVPRDIDEFRNELARRIKGLVEAERIREGEGSGATDSAST